jgi:succinyl-CoA synthetase beta subunit
MNLHKYQAEELLKKYGVPIRKALPAAPEEDYCNIKNYILFT